MHLVSLVHSPVMGIQVAAVTRLRKPCCGEHGSVHALRAVFSRGRRPEVGLQGRLVALFLLF